MKWRSAIAVTMLVFGIGICGCGKTTKDPDGKIEITLWHIQNYEATKAVIDSAVARYMKDHPNVKVNVVAYKNDDFKTKLKTSMGAGKVPDIYHTWGGGVLKEQYDAGYVMDLTDLYSGPAFKGRFSDNAMAMAEIDGKPLLVPCDISAVFVYYNKEIFTKHGITPPTTMAEFRDICAKLKAAGVIPITLGNVNKWTGCFYYIYGVIGADGQKAIADAGQLKEGAFNDPAFTAGSQLVLDMVDMNCFNPGFQGINFQASRKQLFTGRAAMTLMGTWIAANAKSEAPDMLDKLGCFYFPVPGKKILAGGTNCAFAVNPKGPHTKDAVELLKYLSDETFASEWARAGRVPACKGATENDMPALAQQGNKLLIDADGLQLYFDQMFPPAVADKHKATCQALFSKEMTPAQVNEAMEKAAQDVRGN